MNEEDYVSFKTTKRLKENGFDWRTYAYYEDEDNPNISLHASKAINWNKTDFISKPTLQMAMKWLRKTHNQPINVGHFQSYEEACEEAINYYLDNLSEVKKC